MEKNADKNLTVLKREGRNHTPKNVFISVLFSAILLVGIMVCLICDLAISGTFTWSLIPVSSIVFAWVIGFPSIRFGKKGIAASLLLCSVFIIPYLFLLSRFIKTKEVFSIGAAMASASIAFLWILWAVFSRLGKTRKLAALGVAFLFGIPFVIVINVILSEMIAEPIWDVWDIFSVFVLLILALVSFICDYVQKKNGKNNPVAQDGLS